MSPSESDLRAALRDGERDDVPDVDGLVAHVRGRRAQRRVRVLSAAAAVVVVAGAAVGGAVLWGGSEGGSGQQAGRTGTAPTAVPTSTGASFGVSTATSPQGRTQCPSTAPATVAPVGTAATGPMFAAPVTGVLVCSYSQTGVASPGAGSSGASASVTLSGADASALVTSIEQASTSRLRILCPDIATAEKKELAIVGLTADGRALPTVVTDVSVPNCNRPITNGTAVRWNWKPPASVAALIASVSTHVGGAPAS